MFNGVLAPIDGGEIFPWHSISQSMEWRQRSNRRPCRCLRWTRETGQVGIARELVNTVRSNVTIDWTLRENVRAQLRVLVRRILRKYGYPPDKQAKATQTVLEQAEVLSEGWASD